MTLHIVSKSPLVNPALESCLRVCNKDDSILLLEDGVYAVCGDNNKNSIVAGIDPKIKLYILSEDVDARGVDEYLTPQIEKINYEKFVELTCLHEKTVSWF